MPVQTDGEMIVKRDLAATPPVKMALYSGNYVIEFVNIDKPEDKISASVQAHATDNGDKAPGKALTYAVKMALLKVLSIETGENEESRGEEKERLEELQKFTANQFENTKGEMLKRFNEGSNADVIIDNIKKTKLIERNVQDMIKGLYIEHKEKSNESV